MSQPVVLNVEKIVAGGDGLAFLDGKAVFVPFSMPGETVRCEIVEDRRDYLQADVPELIASSPDRQDPPCPIYRVCGGCNFQHIKVERQADIKTEILEDSFRRTGKVEGIPIKTIPSRAFAYRNRVQFHVSPEHLIGYMRRNSTLVIPIQECPIAVKPIQEWIRENHDLSRYDWGLFSPLSRKDRFLVFGYGDWTAVEGREELLAVPVLEKNVKFHIKGFFQSNVDMLGVLVADLLDGLGGESVLDLYCGVGTFDVFLADRFSRVSGVEQDPNSIKIARENVPSASFYWKPVEDWVRSDEAGERYDCVVLDPPRSGLSESVREWLKNAKPAVVRYVSCDPVTLARDVGDLVRAGFSVDRVAMYDFYPQTSHIEALVKLRFVER
jgi:23S rRNA (uracil1939-C5)-methyltransferase